MGGSATGTTNPLTITIDTTKTIAANFSAVQYGLSVNINGNGSVTKSPDQLTYDSGTSVILTAIPADGQQFTGCSDDGMGDDNPLTIIMNANKTVTATFEITNLLSRASKQESVQTENKENKKDKSLQEDRYSRPRLKIYPNPFAGDRLKIEMFDLPKQQNVNIFISDIFGNVYQTMKAETDKTGTLNRQINFNKILSKGIYILTINTSSLNKHIKVILN